MNEIVQYQNLIYDIRGVKVMLDSDLADLYGMAVKKLNETVKRNINRFPLDFMFQLTDVEWERLRSQIATSNVALTFQNTKSSKRGGRRYLPFVFTEQGVAMLSSVLNSPNAIGINIAIMRAFVKMRHFVQQRLSVADEIKELKQMLLLHIDNTKTGLDEHTQRINEIITVLNNLIEKPPPQNKIGFHQ